MKQNRYNRIIKNARPRYLFIMLRKKIVYFCASHVRKRLCLQLFSCAIDVVERNNNFAKIKKKNEKERDYKTNDAACGKVIDV